MPEDVPALMDRLFDVYAHLEDDPYQIARAHWMFEKIHPFSDGNGRVGRLVMYKELLRIDALPVIIHDSLHDRYVANMDKFPEEPGWLVELLLFERDIYKGENPETDRGTSCPTRTTTIGTDTVMTTTCGGTSNSNKPWNPKLGTMTASARTTTCYGDTHDSHGRTHPLRTMDSIIGWIPRNSSRRYSAVTKQGERHVQFVGCT